MADRRGKELEITTDVLLKAYALGVFPMAQSRDDPSLYWVNPERRGVLPLDEFHVPKNLMKLLRRGVFEVRCDTAFEAVLEGCAEVTEERPDTWINAAIFDLFSALHRDGHAHSVECWLEGKLVGGLYGLSMGGAFFGESMFTRVTDASKVALCHLVARLVVGGYTLLDTQFVTAHLRRFGAREITRRDYLERLSGALAVSAVFPASLPDSDAVSLLRQRNTQTS